MRRSVSEVKSIGQEFIPVYVALGALACVVLYYMGTQDSRDNQNHLETGGLVKSEEPLKCPDGWMGRALKKKEWPYKIIRELGDSTIVEPPPYMYVDKNGDHHTITTHKDWKKFNNNFQPGEVICIPDLLSELYKTNPNKYGLVNNVRQVLKEKSEKEFVHATNKQYEQTSREVQAIERGKRWF